MRYIYIHIIIGKVSGTWVWWYCWYLVPHGDADDQNEHVRASRACRSKVQLAMKRPPRRFETLLPDFRLTSSSMPGSQRPYLDLQSTRDNRLHPQKEGTWSIMVQLDGYSEVQVLCMEGL